MAAYQWKDWASRSIGRQAAAATVLSLMAIGIRTLLDPWIGDRQEFLSAYGAVAVATWLATWRAGVGTAVVTIGGMAWLFDVPPNDAQALSEWHGTLDIATAVCVSALIIFFEHRSATSRNALLKQVESLDEADHRKSDFLALVAHELRNPLSTVMVGTGVIKKGIGPSSLSGTLDMVERQAHVMQRLVNDLLDVARIEQGKIELTKEKTAISRVIECAITDVSSLMHQCSPRIVYVPQQAGAALIDPLRIGQVVGNLLHNAVKFSPPDGVVTVTAGGMGRDFFISVKDEGIGIPSDELHTIFESFVQLDAASAHPPGLGLGLSLSRKLVEMHGGVLQASSDGPGRGAEFVIRLPRGLPQDVTESSCPPGTDAAERRKEAEAPAPLRLLVVDDNRDAAESLALLLTLKGYTASTAGDGRAALEAAITERPDIVFLDIGLPDMSGHQVAMKLRQQMVGGKQPVLVALTGCGSRGDVERSRRAGFDTHLTKPISIEQLDEALDIAKGKNEQQHLLEAFDAGQKHISDAHYSERAAR